MSNFDHYDRGPGVDYGVSKPPEPLASQGQRLGNYLLDFVFLLVFSVILGVILGLLGLGDYIQQVNEYLFGAIILLLYYIPQEAIWGRTVGKLITKTKAVSADGSPLSFGQAIGRTLCRFIPFDNFSFLVGKEGPRGWHDSIPKTKVISLR